VVPEVKAADSHGNLARVPISAVVGLNFDYPIRPDFLASLIVPRDLNVAEARRLTAFL
jgi:hypothetical protein